MSDPFDNARGRVCKNPAFTRNPNDGTKVLYGEYLVNAQGEDVVAGIRTPRPIHADGRTPGGEPTSFFAASEAFHSLP